MSQLLIYCTVNVKLPWIIFLVLQEYDDKCLRLLFTEFGVDLTQFETSLRIVLVFFILF